MRMQTRPSASPSSPKRILKSPRSTITHLQLTQMTPCTSTLTLCQRRPTGRSTCFMKRIHLLSHDRRSATYPQRPTGHLQALQEIYSSHPEVPQRRRRTRVRRSAISRTLSSLSKRRLNRLSNSRECNSTHRSSGRISSSGVSRCLRNRQEVVARILQRAHGKFFSLAIALVLYEETSTCFIFNFIQLNS